MIAVIIITAAVWGACALLLWRMREAPPSAPLQARVKSPTLAHARAAETGGFDITLYSAMTVSEPSPQPVAPPKRNRKGKRGQSKRAKRARGGAR